MRIIAMFILVAALSCVIVGLGQSVDDVPLTREWVFVWVDKEPASNHEHFVSQVFGTTLLDAATNFVDQEPKAIVICAARVGDGKCFRKSTIVYQP